MYVTYETNQLAYGQKPKLTALDYRPQRVIRISDMAVVPGTEATHGYCALSYSWTWGGERTTLPNGNLTVVDKGHHLIMTQDNPRHVHFETFLQQLCNDFNIDYLWYDRMCVDMNDAQEKIQSIQNMYNVYNNALFTVALVPEMDTLMEKAGQVSVDELHTTILEQCLDQLLASEWCTRVWLLAEAMLSPKIMFVGKNVHLWSTALNQYPVKNQDALKAVQALSGEKDASKVLWHVHRRNTAIEIDRVMALVHIYKDVVNMEITTEIDLKEYMLDFYSQLAKNDLTILCFGKQQHSSTVSQHTFLPSWTGVHGTHIQYASLKQLYLPDSFEPYTVVGAEMFLCCDAVTCAITPIDIRHDYGVMLTHAVSDNGALFLSLTDDDCQECIILNIPFDWDVCTVYPVVRKEIQDFTSIGIACIPHRPSAKTLSLNEFGIMSNSSFVIK